MFDSLKGYLNTPITIKPALSTDDAGDYTYSAPVSALCYVEEKTKIVVSTNGTDVTSHTTLYIDGSVTIGSLDLVTYGIRDYPIKAIDHYVDGAGNTSLILVYI